MNKITGVGVIIISGAFTFLGGCAEKSTSPKGEVLARVGKSVITTEDLKQEWRRQYFAPQNQPREGAERLLDDMVVEKLFLSEARRRKIDRDPRFQQEVDNYREQLLVETLLNKSVLFVGQPSEAEIESYWKDNQAQFTVPQLVRVSHIMIKRSEEEDSVTEKRCEEILARLRGGEDFARVARDVSEGASAIKGGDMGFFRNGQLAPELDQAAWSLGSGEFAGPIKTEYGYHIITVTTRKSPRLKDLEESRPDIIKAIQSKNRKSKFESLQAELKNTFPVTINQEVLKRITVELVPQP